MKRYLAVPVGLILAATSLVASPATAVGEEVEVTVSPGEALEKDGALKGPFVRKATGVFVASIPSPVDHDVKFRATTRNNTAVASRDYRFFTRLVNIKAGETIANIPFTVLGDFELEGTETFSLVLSDPRPGVSFSTNNIVGTIIDDETAASLSIQDLTVTESGIDASVRRGPNDSTKRTIHMRVRTTALLSDNAIVNWRTVDGSGKAGEHYEGAEGSILFRKGELYRDIRVKLAPNDQDVEPDFDFQIELTSVVGPASLGNATATVSVLDDDRVPTITLSGDLEIVEGDEREGGQGIVTVTLDHPSEKIIRLSIGKGSGTARGGFFRQNKGVDFFESNFRGFTKLRPGTTEVIVGVSIRGDEDVEGDEFFYVSVNNFETPNRAIGPDPSRVKVTIIDDD